MSINLLTCGYLQRPIIATLVAVEPLNQEGFSWRSEYSKRYTNGDDSIKVDTRPNEDRGREREEHKWCSRETEDELSCDVGSHVIVGLVRGCAFSIRSQEERPNEAAEIWFGIASSAGHQRWDQGHHLLLAVVWIKAANTKLK